MELFSILENIGKLGNLVEVRMGIVFVAAMSFCLLMTIPQLTLLAVKAKEENMEKALYKNQSYALALYATISMCFAIGYISSPLPPSWLHSQVMYVLLLLLLLFVLGRVKAMATIQGAHTKNRTQANDAIADVYTLTNAEKIVRHFCVDKPDDYVLTRDSTGVQATQWQLVEIFDKVRRKAPMIDFSSLGGSFCVCVCLCGV